ncbi:hypothetical protein, partial [Vogesella indigofera]|uniref:hypothetical protein n=1 Tax=Vogesella indigofera TaxID=45465 RepID=UPI00234F4B86
YLAKPDTYTYRLFVLLKSSAASLVSFAASAEEANYSEAGQLRQHPETDFLTKKRQALDSTASLP